MRLLIVDGYNVIRQTPPYRQLAEGDLESARAALVSDVAAYAAGEWEPIVVFDAHGNPQSRGEPHEIAGVKVIFSPYEIDADSVIETLARKARECGTETCVVTSDAQTQWTVMGGSVSRKSAAEFGSDLNESDQEWRDHTPAGARRSRLEERIDPATAEVLTRWSRGEG